MNNFSFVMYFEVFLVTLATLGPALALSSNSTALAQPTLCMVCPANGVGTDVTITATATSTIYTGAESTSYVFLPGNPSPTGETTNKARRHEQKHKSPCDGKGNETTTTITARVSTASCTCPPLPTFTNTVTAVVSTVTVTSPQPATSTTLYPCASPFPTLTRDLPYGDYSSTGGLETGPNSLYTLDTPQGVSAQACCNTCFFGTQNCIQAYWYSYEGCVIQPASNPQTASGQHVSNSCPEGVFDGLTYAPDTNPAFRSTGNIAGPCGQTYNNL